jgi:hypothetical protein
MSGFARKRLEDLVCGPDRDEGFSVRFRALFQAQMPASGSVTLDEQQFHRSDLAGAGR